MRELKFRVWDKRYKKYVEPYAICLDGRAIVVNKPCNDLETLDSERVIIEQYTGLKDKNGKEIYDWDIVSEHHGDIIGKIVQNHSGEYRIAWLGICGGDSSLYEHRSLCEVIGNIHETPGLLVEVNDVD